MNRRLPVAVLFSGRGSNLASLIDARQSGQLPVDIVAAISDRANAPGLRQVFRGSLPAYIIEYRQAGGRKRFETLLASALDAARPRLIILAGFMRVLTAAFVDRYRGRMINLHPALLPAHRGLDTHRRVLRAGDTQHGSSIHFVTETLDGGPVLAQYCMPVAADDTPETLAARLLPHEHRLLAACTALFSRHEVTCRDDRIVIDGQPLNRVLQLDEDIHWPP